MANEWKDYIVQTRRVIDSSGKEHTYQIPPSWKLELLIWDIFHSLELNQDIASTVDNFDLVMKAVSLVLDLEPTEIEELFALDDIEDIFAQIWVCIAPSEEELRLVETHVGREQQSFTIDQALAMFAVECGWDPSRVLEMPKRQVIPLAEAISEYVSQRMKFQAAIHGIDVDEGAKGATNTQIEDERYWKDLSKELPIEVK